MGENEFSSNMADSMETPIEIHVETKYQNSQTCGKRKKYDVSMTYVDAMKNVGVSQDEG